MCFEINAPWATSDKIVAAYKVFYKTKRGLHSIYRGNSPVYDKNGDECDPEKSTAVGYKQGMWLRTRGEGFQAFTLKKYAEEWARIHANQVSYKIIKVKFRRVKGVGSVGIHGPSNCAYAALEMYIPKN